MICGNMKLLNLFTALFTREIQLQQNSYKVNHFRKVYFDVWELKLKILTCFNTVLSHLRGVTFKNMSNTLKKI